MAWTMDNFLKMFKMRFESYYGVKLDFQGCVYLSGPGESCWWCTNSIIADKRHLETVYCYCNLLSRFWYYIVEWVYYEPSSWTDCCDVWGLFENPNIRFILCKVSEWTIITGFSWVRTSYRSWIHHLNKKMWKWNYELKWMCHDACKFDLKLI